MNQDIQFKAIHFYEKQDWMFIKIIHVPQDYFAGT